MTGKHKIARRILALVLCAVLVIPMGATGVGSILSSEMWNSLVPTAQAVTANSAETLKTQIENASTSGTTTIQLNGDITDLQYALPVIDDNIILDLNGYDITYTYSATGDKDSSNLSSTQLPKGNAGNSVNTDVISGAFFTVAQKGTLQIINTSDTDSTVKMVSEYTFKKKGVGAGADHTIQTSSNLIYCLGTLLIGDKNAKYNNFSLVTRADSNMEDVGGVYDQFSYASAMTVTLNGSDAVLKMYGGTLLASARAVGFVPTLVDVHATPIARCYPLNVNNCKSAEIYGGTISIDKNYENGVFNTNTSTSIKANCASYFTAIRCNVPNVYVFDVSSDVYAKAGKKTWNNTAKSGATINVANIWVTGTNNAPIVMGGTFSSDYSRDDDSPATVNANKISGSFHAPVQKKGSNSYGFLTTHGHDASGTGTFTLFTIFYTADAQTNNANWYGKFTTVAEWAAEANMDVTYLPYIVSYTSGGPYFVSRNYPESNATGNEIPLSFLYTRTAYAHTGWCAVWPGSDKPVDNFTGTVSNADTFGGTGGTVFIQPTWTAKTYQASFDPNGGLYNNITTSTSISYDIENTNKMYMPLPTRSGYTFTGWKVDSLVESEVAGEFGNWPIDEVFAADTPMKDYWGHVKFVAQWTPTTYTVTFDTDGGAAIDPISYNIETGGTLPVAQKAGYTFQSWHIESVENGGGVVTGGTMLAGDFGVKLSNGSPVWGNITLKAVYTPNNYTLSYNLNGGDGKTPDSKNVTFDAKYGTLPTASRSGYGFNGWYTAATGGEKVDADTIYKIAGDSTLYAQWVANGYNVSFYYNYGTMGLYDSIGVVYDSPYNINSAFRTPERPGYNFAGWYTQPSGGTRVYETDIYKIAGHSSLYAHWDYATYTLTFDENGGTDVADFTYSIGDTFKLPESTRNGYSLRWIADSDAGSWKKGSQYAPGEYSGEYGTLHFTAQWTKIPYTVSLNTAGGNVNPSSVSYDVETAAALPAPSRAGYEFLRWEVSECADICSFTVGDEVASIEAGNYGNITLTAVWKPIAYTLTFDLFGGEYDGETVYTYTIEETLNIIKPTRTAYTFIQWKVKDNVGNWIANEYVKLTDVLSGKYGDVTLVAQWQSIQYTMSFNSDGGTTLADRDYTIGLGTTLPASEKDGYVFLGWKPDADAGSWKADTTYPAGTAVAGTHYGNVKFTAQWKVATYTAKLDANGGELTETEIEYTILSDIELAAPIRNGYSFVGWQVKENAGSWKQDKVVFSIDHGNFGDVELVAQWTLNKYDANFYSNDTLQTDFTVEDYDIASGITLPGMPGRDHYVFKGWIPAESVGSWVAGEVYPAGAYPDAWGTVRFDARWEKETYTVTWKNADATLETDTVEYGVLPEYNGDVPTKEADEQYTYTFDGWEPVVGAADKDIVYNAVFEKTLRTYTVTWVVEGETTTSSFAYGEKPDFGSIPVKEETSKYQFVGWFTENNEALSVVTGDVIYIAKFNEITDPVKVTWVVDGKEYVTYGQKETVPAFYGSVEKADAAGYRYTFAGWNDANGNPVDLSAEQLSADVTYYAVFNKQAIGYTATLRANGGTVENDSLPYNIEATLTLPTPTRDGYTFTGWKPATTVGNWDANTSYSAGAVTSMYGDVTLVAQWTATGYAVTIYPADGTAEYDMTYTIDGSETLPTVTRAGYTFTGWYVLLGEGSWQPGQVLDLNEALAGNYGNLTVQAQWQINRYTITWVVGGTSSTETYVYGTAVTQRSVPEKIGYIAAWDIGTLPQVMPAQNLVITAVYTLREYTISYNANGGEMPADYVTTYNITSTAALPQPTKQGSLFAGWQVVSEGGNWILNTTTAVSATLAGRYGNVSLKAVWTPTIHAITWVVDDAERIAHWYYGATPSYDGIPEKEADAQFTYTFVGWDKEIVAVTGDATYKAIFERTVRSYTVTWMREDTVLLEQTYEYGELPEYSGATPNKAPDNFFAYTFNGWSPEITAVTGPQTYYAQFTVYRFVQSVVLNYSSITLVNGNTVQLTASVYPTDADYPDVQWYSLDEKIAKVDSNGFVTAVGVGTTSICVRSLEKPELVAVCTIRVTPIYVTWLEITAASNTKLPIGQTVQLSYILRPDNATNVAVNWVSVNSAVAIVGTNGLVTLVGAGTTTIYCYSADGYCTGSIEVTGLQAEVEDPDEDENKYVIVWFPYSQAAGGYIINGQTIEDGTIKIPYGSDISFKLVNDTKDITVRVDGGGAYYPDADGYYTVHNVTSDISILVFTSGENNLDDEITNDPDANKSFFDKLGDFFRKIVLWFRSLFGMN